MNDLLIISFLISAAVVFIMMKQLDKVTKKIDEKSAKPSTNVYADFSAYIQETLRLIKSNINHEKETSNPKYILIDETFEEQSLEFLSDNIRKLVSYETISARTKPSHELEQGLFEILSSIDDFLVKCVKNGEELAEELRQDFANKFKELKKA